MPRAVRFADRFNRGMKPLLQYQTAPRSEIRLSGRSKEGMSAGIASRGHVWNLDRRPSKPSKHPVPPEGDLSQFQA